MDELPAHARAILRAAKRAHQPPAHAMSRARQRLDAALLGKHAPSPVPSRSERARRAWQRSTVGKLVARLAVMGILSLGIFELSREPTPVSTVDEPAFAVPADRTSAAPTAQPDLRVARDEARGPAPATTPAAGDPSEPLENSAPKPVQAVQRRERNIPSLDAEMQLLTAAAAAVDSRDFAQARVLLRAHRLRFTAGKLAQERTGLEILMKCLTGAPNAATHAQAYLRNSPGALLSMRMRGACALP